MKKFFREHGIWVLFATAVIAVSLSLMSFFSNTSSPLSNLAGIIASPFRSAYTAVTGWITDKQNYYQDVTALENYDLELETASVTERTVTNWTSSLTLNIGTDHGVEVNDCVIDETYALVGVVSEVGLNWCTVLTIVDTDTSLGAQVFRTKDLGLAVGDFSLMRENRLRLDYLPADCQLLGGDLVVTSGLGGYYPSGLSVGTVEEVQLSDSGAASYAVLEPAADFDSLVEVFVIKSFDIQT